MKEHVRASWTTDGWVVFDVVWSRIVWDEHKERTGESGMDKGFVWRNGQRQKPRGACEKRLWQRASHDDNSEV